LRRGHGPGGQTGRGQPPGRRFAPGTRRYPPHRNLDDFLPHLDLLVQSQLTRGMPNVVPEASAAGVPVVATGVGGTPEITVEGCSGYLVPAGDSPLLAQPTLITTVFHYIPLRWELSLVIARKTCP